MVQWLWVGASTAGAWVQALVKELRSHKPSNMTKKKKKKKKKREGKNKEEEKEILAWKIFCLAFISEFYYFHIFTNFSQSTNSKKLPQCPYPYLWGNLVYLFNWTRQYLVISLYLHILFSLLRTLSFLNLGMDFLENMIK